MEYRTNKMDSILRCYRTLQTIISDLCLESCHDARCSCKTQLELVFREVAAFEIFCDNPLLLTISGKLYHKVR